MRNRNPKIGPKGTMNRSVLVELENGPHYHATKGWRMVPKNTPMFCAYNEAGKHVWIRGKR